MSNGQSKHNQRKRRDDNTLKEMNGEHKAEIDEITKWEKFNTYLTNATKQGNQKQYGSMVKKNTQRGKDGEYNGTIKATLIVYLVEEVMNLEE